MRTEEEGRGEKEKRRKSLLLHCCDSLLTTKEDSVMKLYMVSPSMGRMRRERR